MTKDAKKRNRRIAVFSVLTVIAAASLALSVFVELKYLDKNVVWQCLIGAVWTILSIVALLLFGIRIFNAYFDVQKIKPSVYSDRNGVERKFEYKSATISAISLKAFLADSDLPEKVCVLSNSGVFAQLDMTMEQSASMRKFLTETKLYELCGNVYADIDEAFDVLSDSGYIDDNGNLHVIDYEYSTPTYLLKLIGAKYGDKQSGE